MTNIKVTIDHDEIKQWVESLGGKPASAIPTRTDDDPGILNLYFEGLTKDKSIGEITWEQFFSKFESKQLAFMYRPVSPDNPTSRFFKLVRRSDKKINRKIQNH